MKKLFAILFVSLFLLHFAGVYTYFGVRVMAIHNDMRQLLKATPAEELELIKLTKTEYQRSLRDKGEVEWRGKMYDIARVQIKDGIYFVYALHDGAEDSLLSFLDEVLKRSTRDKKPIPTQLLSFINWVYLPAYLELSFSANEKLISNTAYLAHYASLAAVIDSPPPRN